MIQKGFEGPGIEVFNRTRHSREVHVKRFVAAVALAAAGLAIVPGAAQANPVDDLRNRVADFYNQKIGCESGRPLICPGPWPG